MTDPELAGVANRLAGFGRSWRSATMKQRRLTTRLTLDTDRRRRVLLHRDALVFDAGDDAGAHVQAAPEVGDSWWRWLAVVVDVVASNPRSRDLGSTWSQAKVPGVREFSACPRHREGAVGESRRGRR